MASNDSKLTNNQNNLGQTKILMLSRF